MLGLPDLIGRILDVEEPPYNHQGAGMRCLLVKVGVDFKGVYVQDDTSMVWYIEESTRITLIDPMYQHYEMETWRAQTTQSR